MLARDFARALDTALIMQDCGLAADPWQQGALRSEAKKALWLVSRQGGKSTTAAARALGKALYEPPALLLLSPSLRQSQELFRKVNELRRDLEGAPKPSAESALRCEFSNGSRIVSLPGTESTIRGFSGVDLLLLDEAARIDDELIAAVRPMLATKNGAMVALTTPAGKRGWFYDVWSEPGDWEKVEVSAPECPRISPEWLEAERHEMAAWQFEQEYFVKFHDPDEAVFGLGLIRGAVSPEVSAIWL